MARLNGLQTTQIEVFCETAQLLDFLLERSDVSQHEVDSLWTIVLINVRKWQSDATDYDKQMVTETVFHVVRATLAQHAKGIYRENICDMLNSKLCQEQKHYDEKEQEEFLERLIDVSPMLSEWINYYDNADEWLSDQIDDVITEGKKEGENDDFEPSGTTFTKTALLTDTLIDLIGQRLAMDKKLEASPDDFRKLFSGIDQKFDMVWLGTEGELRDLFKMLTDSKNQYAKPRRGYQQILKSHFLNEDKKRFSNLHGAKTIETFKPVIDDCAFLLQHLTDNMTSIMKQIINENENALREAGYFDSVQAAKQSGLSIRKKRR